MPFKSFPGSYSLMTMIGNALNCKTITKEISLFFVNQDLKKITETFSDADCTTERSVLNS